MLRIPTALRLLAVRFAYLINLLLLHSPLLVLAVNPPSPPIITSVISGGFQYQLANPSVSDITPIDFSGDDCLSLPCPAFPLPPTCVLAPTPPSPTLLLPAGYGWATPFLATAAGLNATSPLVTPYASDTSWLTASNGTHIWLTDSDWSARILLRCGIPCAAGTYLSATTSTCLPCPLGTWSAPGINATACTACANAPLNAVYTGAGAATSPSCPFTCPTGTYAQPDNPYSPLLLVSAGTSLYALPPNNGTILALPFFVGQILCIEAADSLDQIFFATASTIYSASGTQPGRPPTVIATGFVFLSSIRLFQNGTTLVAVDQGMCSVKLISIANRTGPLLMAGGTCGYADGPGETAKFRYPVDLVVDHDRGVAYIADEYNYRVRMMQLFPPYNVTTLVGNGAGGQWDAVGTAATVDPFYLALSPDGNTLYVRCPGLIRRIDLATMQITTMIYGIRSSGVGVAIGPLSGQLYYGTMDQYVGSPINVLINAMRLPSYTAVPFRAVNSPTLTNWASVLVINETLRTASPQPPICAACIVCSPGRYAQCNTTYSGCAPCPPGAYSAAPGMTSPSCSLCQPGTFSPAPGASACLSCANGSFAQTPGASACKLCPTNTYASQPLTASSWCAACATGTYADRNGSNTCQRCPFLPYLATWTQPVSGSATMCPFACPSGTVFNGTACGGCDIGTWSSSPTGICANCTNLPANAYYTGVGASPTTCAYKCNAGYLSSPYTPATPCAPCPAGSRYVSPPPNQSPSCPLCNAGAYSTQPASLTCLPCPAGTYSLAGYTTCVQCSVTPNNYTVFIGRGTSPSCAFYCKPGSMLNRTYTPQCTQCAAGTFAPAPSSTACTACAGGTWAGPGATACSACLSA